MVSIQDSSYNTFMPETQDPTNGTPGKEAPKESQASQPADRPTSPSDVPSGVAAAKTPGEQMKALAIDQAQVERLKQLHLRDPHTAFIQGASDILNNPTAPGLSIGDIKGLFEPVFTSGAVFPADTDTQFAVVEPRLDFQPVMAVLSDTMQNQLGTEIIVANGRLFSLLALAARLETTPDDIKARLRGKTAKELAADPALQAIIGKTSHPRYSEGIKRDVIDPEIATLGQAVDKTLKGQTPQLDSIDTTTISRVYPDRPLTEVERNYMELVRRVALTSQVNADDTYGPVGLSETFLYDIWKRLIARTGHTPRIDFDPVVAALSPRMREITTADNSTPISLQPRMQLYANTKLGPLPPQTQLSNAPADVLKLLRNYDTVKTQVIIEDTVGGGPTR